MFIDIGMRISSIIVKPLMELIMNEQMLDDLIDRIDTIEQYTLESIEE